MAWLCSRPAFPTGPTVTRTRRALVHIATALLLFGGVMPAFAQGPAAPRGIYADDLDRAADPCTDFFRFANGAWRAANPIPASMDRWSRRWQAGETNKEQVKAILDDLARRTDWPAGTPQQLVSDYYGSCMDEARADALGSAPLKPIFERLDAVTSLAQLQGVLRDMHARGLQVPFGIYAASDDHDPGQVIAHVYAGGLGLPDRDYYLKPDARFAEARKEYAAHLARLFGLAGVVPEKARAAASTVLAFETTLAGAHLDNVALRDPTATDHKMTVTALAALTPSLDWPAYFEAARIPPRDLNVTQPGFMRAVERQLATASIDEWKTYLKWHELRSAAPWLSRPLVEESFAFNGRFLEGRQEMKPRWTRCVENTDALLGEALGQEYVKRHFPPEAKARAEEMVRNILAAMGDTIRELSWMSAATRTKALEKLSTFTPKIGYPGTWKDYQGLTTARGDFWQNLERAQVWDVAEDRSRIGRPVDRDRWGMTPPTSNAYYNPLLNEIVFPAGILQPPAFDVRAADAVNYGAIGVVIGHEISHGFDDQGAQYDAQGRLRNWWTPQDLARFRERTACVVTQFDAYAIEPGIFHQGKLVLGEAIGDLAGAKIAYRAFQKAKAQRPQPTIDGFTPDQQFFIAWGQFRGDETRPETQRRMVQGDPHPVAKFRVIGPLSNLPAFRQAFACKADAPMVRPAATRCEVW